MQIRHYGFLQNHGKIARLNAVRKQMKLQALYPKDIAVKFKLPAALSKTVPLKNKNSP